MSSIPVAETSFARGAALPSADVLRGRLEQRRAQMKRGIAGSSNGTPAISTPLAPAAAAAGPSPADSANGVPATTAMAQRRQQRRQRLKESLPHGDAVQAASSPPGGPAWTGSPPAASSTSPLISSSGPLSGSPPPSIAVTDASGQLASLPSAAATAPTIPLLFNSLPPTSTSLSTTTLGGVGGVGADGGRRLTLKERLQRKREEEGRAHSSPPGSTSPSPSPRALTPTSPPLHEDGSQNAGGLEGAASAPTFGTALSSSSSPPLHHAPNSTNNNNNNKNNTNSNGITMHSVASIPMMPSPTQPVRAPAPHGVRPVRRAHARSRQAQREAYDFFTSEFVGEEEEENAGNDGLDGGDGGVQGGDRGASPVSAAPAAPAGDEVPVGAGGWRDYLQQVVEGGEAWQDMLGAFGPPLMEYTPELQRMAIEANIYTVPPSTPASFAQRLKAGQDPMYVEDDGLFVGILPYPSQRQLHRMEHRALSWPNKHEWFGPDGSLKRCAVPLLIHARHVPPVDPDVPLIETFFGKAQTPLFDLTGVAVHSGVGDGSCLEVAVGALSFSSHPLFSVEDRLAAHLVALCTELQQRRDTHVTETLEGRLRALREGVARADAQLQAHPLSQAEPMGGIGAEHAQEWNQLRARIGEYRSEIEVVREARDAALKRDYELVGEVLQAWSDVKLARQQQGFSVTPWALVVYRQAVDAEAERQKLHDDVRAELKERRAQYEASQRQQQRAYLDRQARRLMAQENRGEEPTADIDSLPANLRVPFDKVEAKREITVRLRAGRRPVGEPLLVPVLQSARAPSAVELCPAEERQRRHSLTNELFYVRLLVDGLFVSRTPPRPLNISFAIQFREVFTVNVARAPTSVLLQLWQAPGGGHREMQLCEIPIPVPGSDVVAATAFPHQLTFQARRGPVLLAAPVQPPEAPTQAGQTTLGLGSVGTGGRMRAAGPDIDPNDPRNATLSLPQNALPGTHFRMARANADDRVLFPAEPTRREQALLLRSMRSAKAPKGPVPIREADLPSLAEGDADGDEVDEAAAAAAAAAALAAEAAGRMAEEVFARIAEIRKAAIARISADVRARQRQRAQQQHLSFSDVVEEDLLPSIGSLGSAIAALFAPRRPLRPLRRARKPAPLASHPQCRLLVRVVRALDIPKRDVNESHRAGHTTASYGGASSILGSGAQAMSTQSSSSQLFGAGGFTQGTSGGASGLAGGTGGGGGGSILISSNPAAAAALASFAGISALPSIPNAAAAAAASAMQPGMAAAAPGAAASMDMSDLVRPFVEVSFQRNTQSTRVAMGHSPSWNEEIALPFTPPNNDFSPDGLLACTDNVFFNLYDELLEIIPSTAPGSGDIIQKRRVRRWLGTTSIPISSLYTNQVIDGNLRLNVPIMLLGYHRGTGASSELTSVRLSGIGDGGGAGAGSGAFAAGGGGSGAGRARGLSGAAVLMGGSGAMNLGLPSSRAPLLSSSLPQPSSAALGASGSGMMGASGTNNGNAAGHVDDLAHTYLQVFMTLDPPLRIPPPQTVAEKSMEEASLLAFVAHWEADLRKLHPEYPIRTLAQDINATSLCVTRFIHPQAPPLELLQDVRDVSTAMARLARFVACIPQLPDQLAFLGNVDLWCSSDQFLKMMAGDAEEHAILLCNYFLHLQVQAWAVVGEAVPEGPSVFVLTLMQDEYMLWDAQRGARYEIHNSLCPLQKISAIFNHGNVWGNVQESGVPSRMTFDVRLPKYWRPLFGKALARPSTLSTVQVAQLAYTAADYDAAQQLADALDETLRRRFESWRHLQVTRWNRHAADVLRGALLSFEDALTMHQPVGAPLADLQALVQTYDMVGVPLNLPYTTAEQVVEALRNVGIHAASGTGLEFALATHVHAYPNGVFSVWVYVAELRRKP